MTIVPVTPDTSGQNPNVRAMQDITLKFVDAAAESTRRARLVLLVMIVASVITFAASWNTGSHAWLAARVEVSEDVARWWAPLIDACKRTGNDCGASPPAAIPTDMQSRWRRATIYLLRASMRDSTYFIANQVDARVFREQRDREMLLVRVPFFGVAFDVNDLGILSGFGFSVILLWFTYTLASEFRDMGIALNEAPSRELRQTAYKLILMQQVLTVPETPGNALSPALRWAPKVLYLLPFLVYSRIAYLDVVTQDIGNSLSHYGTVVGIIGAVIFWLAIILLTFVCFLKSLDLDKQWAAFGVPGWNASGAA